MFKITLIKCYWIRSNLSISSCEAIGAGFTRRLAVST